LNFFLKNILTRPITIQSRAPHRMSNHPEPESLSRIPELAAKLALELVYAEPGKDVGLLPVNNLLAQIEELSADGVLPPPISQMIQRGRFLVDAVFEVGTFQADSLEGLSHWVHWMQGALECWVGERPLPEIPPAVSASSGEPSPVRSAPAPSSPPPSAAPAEKSEPGAEQTEAPLVMNLGQDSELLKEFLSESQEHLQAIELGVLVLEEHPDDAETLGSIFRAFHTFKGGSGLLQLTPIYELAHELESLLDQARQNRLEITSETINLILSGADVFKQFIGAMELQLSGQAAAAPIVIPTSQLLRSVQAHLRGLDPAPSSGSKKAPGAHPENRLASSESVRSTPAGGTAPRTPDPGQRGAKKGGNGAGVVKVDTCKLDSLIDLVGEMVIAQSLVAQDPDLKGLNSQHLARSLGQLGSITRELQRTAMSLRMIPIRSTFQKMTRLVRDLAAKQSKQVELVLSGEDTELDRTIVEEISDPLVHMIRNALDHGIETPKARLEKGKAPQGKIQLRAFHKGGNIVIEMADDGAGLNREKILRKGIEKGLIRADQNLTDDQVYSLIFAPGFSTADQVTEISGRGVGMDVVRTNIEKLRGKVEIRSEPGRGCTITVYLPLTLAIIDGLLLSVGEHRYILPTLSVRESFRPTPEMISTVQERGEMINVRGRLSPLLRLYQFFGVKPHATDPSQAIVLVVESDHESRSIMVDQLLGKQEVVIKSLGETFKQQHAISGAAILGDGRVGLILDVNALVKLQGTRSKG
jgi:two-component system chemotaxis sensor kinase CheA